MGTKATFRKIEQKKQDQNPMGTFGEPQTDHPERLAGRKAHEGAKGPGGDIRPECHGDRSRVSGASVGPHSAQAQGQESRGDPKVDGGNGRLVPHDADDGSTVRGFVFQFEDSS